MKRPRALPTWRTGTHNIPGRPVASPARAANEILLLNRSAVSRDPGGSRFESMTPRLRASNLRRQTSQTGLRLRSRVAMMRTLRHADFLRKNLDRHIYLAGFPFDVSVKTGWAASCRHTIRSTKRKRSTGTLTSEAANSTRIARRSGQRLPANSSYAVYVEALVRDFDGLRAVDEVKLRIPAGEIYGFLGPNVAEEANDGPHAVHADEAHRRAGLGSRV
jgi:hypothetical protein